MALAIASVTSASASATTLYFEGFEGGVAAGGVPSGTDGITAASGSYFYEAGSNAYTKWGGYNNSTGGTPGAFKPYTTSIDIFLNLAGGAANDTRFDFSNAINDPSGNFLRDFVFNAGFYDSADMTGPGAGSDRFIISASNNAGRGSAYPKNPGRNPIAITSSGWYNFQEAFYNNAGVLGVKLNVFDASNSAVGSWDLGGDPISGVGGNRYGWFASNEFNFLGVDNLKMTVPAAVPIPGTLPLIASVFGLFGLFGGLKRRKTSMTT